LRSGTKEKYRFLAGRKASALADAVGIPPPPIFPGKNLKEREIEVSKCRRFHGFRRLRSKTIEARA